MELKYEAYLVPPQPRQLRIIHSGDILTVHEGSTRTRLIQSPDNVEKSRLARPGRAHYHHELSLPEFQRDTAERIYRDRKSTRLNSSHPSISYAVFCLKKKKKKYKTFNFTKKKKYTN